MEYAVQNPVPWGLFLGGLLLCIISAKLFHRKYPDYPFGKESGEVQAWEIAVPVKKLLEGNLPRCRVHENTPISALEQLLAEGVQMLGQKIPVEH